MNWLIILFKNQVFQTVIAGVSVFVLGQMIQKFILEPIYEFKEVIGKIDNRLKFYSNITGNPGIKYIPKEIYIECSKSIRQLSCDLESSFKRLPFMCLFKYKVKMISESAEKLIRISNNLWQMDNKTNKPPAMWNYEDEQTVRKYLKIEKL